MFQRPFASFPTSWPLELPRRAQMFCGTELVTVGSARSFRAFSTQSFTGCTVQSSPANGDTFTIGLFAAAGMYTLSVLYFADSDKGIVDYYIDDVKIMTVDQYSAATVWNSVSSASASIRKNGWHSFKSVVNGKNASSSNYKNIFTMAYLYPAKD